MRLEGSCHCGAVRFSVESRTPCPYMRCYCSVCRKTAGGGGYAINLAGRADTLKLTGAGNSGVYHAKGCEGRGADSPSPAERRFCRRCGSALYLWDPRWPELVHPFASAIDTPLPLPAERVHIMLASKADWVDVPSGPHDLHFDGYPAESIEEWHRRRGLLEP